MSIVFQRAVKAGSKLRLALDGPPGAGKTYTALTVATHLGGRVVVLDTERGSAAKYANDFEFDHYKLGPPYSPQRYNEVIQAAGEQDYATIVIDSLSHAWAGTGGVLEIKDNIQKRSKSGDGFGAWRDATPLHNSLVDSILDFPGHVITTMRSKVAYDYSKNDDGKLEVKKLGLAPIQRDGLAFEFDVVGDMDDQNTLVISKTRCQALRGAIIREPGKEFAKTLLDWLEDAEPLASGTTKAIIKDTINSLSDRQADEVKNWCREQGITFSSMTKAEADAVLKRLAEVPAEDTLIDPEEEAGE